MTAEQHRTGKLEQVCPACGIREAAGSYCSACVARTGPKHWRLTERSDAQRAASRASGHSRGFRGVVTEKSANPGLVAYPIKPLRAPSEAPADSSAPPVRVSAEAGVSLGVPRAVNRHRRDIAAGSIGPKPVETSTKPGPAA